MNILAENAASSDPSTSDLKAWADSYGFGANLYAIDDSGSTIFNSLYPGANGWMGSMMLAVGMEITFVGGGKVADADVEAVLP